MTFWKKKQFWGALIGLALLVYCFKDVDRDELRALSQRVEYLWLIPAVASAFLFIALRAVRLRLLVSSHANPPLWESICLYGAGAVFSVGMPALTGQVGKLLLLSRKLGLKKSFVFSSMFLEIVFDAVSLIVFVFFTSLVFAFPKEYRSIGIVLTSLTILALVMLYMILHGQKWLEKTTAKLFRSSWPTGYVVIRKFIRTFVRGTMLLRSSKHMVRAIALSLLAWLAHLAVVVFLFHAFNMDIPSPWTIGAALMIINTVVLMIPIAPGSAGVFEFTVKTFLTKVSSAIAPSDALLFALTLHIADLLPIFTFGFLYLRKDHQFSSILRGTQEALENEDADPSDSSISKEIRRVTR